MFMQQYLNYCFTIFGNWKKLLIQTWKMISLYRNIDDFAKYFSEWFDIHLLNRDYIGQHFIILQNYLSYWFTELCSRVLWEINLRNLCSGKLFISCWFLPLTLFTLYCKYLNKPPGLINFFGLYPGGLFEGGLIEGGLLNFAPKGRNFLQVLSVWKCFNASLQSKNASNDY